VWIDTVGNIAIDDLKPSMSTYVTKRLEVTSERLPEGPENATINRGLAMIKHMANLAVDSNWGWMTRERAVEIARVKMLKEPAGRQRPIKASDLRGILGALQHSESRFTRRVVAADLLTGCRMGELLTLKERQINWDLNLIDLSETKQNRNHQVAITPELCDLLKEAIADRPIKPHDDFVFCNTVHNHYLNSSSFSKHFGHVADRAGVPDITFHDLRRHVGTLLINSGERLEVVSKLLGHSNVAVTLRSYAHLANDATRAAAEKLARVAPALPPPKPSKTKRASKKAIK